MTGQKQQPTTRANGITPAERYLGNLCDRTFLSLWSYPGVYRNQFWGTANDSGKPREGKEVCDLIVVFENRLILFSDKDCRFPNTGNSGLDWNRWFRAAVFQSAKQLWGAERWIREHPDRLFLDRSCKQVFPVRLPDPGNLIVHRIVVAHDVVDRCKREVGGSGSLFIQPSIIGDSHYVQADQGTPFTVGVLDPNKGFVHVLDDLSLKVLLTTLDTVSDFTAYLEAKESLISAGNLLRADGEEDLLALYLMETDESGQHLFPPGDRSLTADHGAWNQFCQHPQRLAQITADEISYLWDGLIEAFCKNILAGTQAFATHSGVANQEIGLRFLARESRVKRRILSKAIIDLLRKTKSDVRATRTISPADSPDDPYYVILLLPRVPQLSDDTTYRTVRKNLLQKYMFITKYLQPAAKHIVGIATETAHGDLHSEDFAYVDVREWTSDQQTEAQKLEGELRRGGLFKTQTSRLHTEYEYPLSSAPTSRGQTREFPRVGRNDPCPCGNGKKYKRCHGR